MKYKYVKRNNFLYEYFVRQKIVNVDKELSGDELLRRIEFAARFATKNNPGLFYDNRLEKELIRIGTHMPLDFVFCEKLMAGYTLHVATQINLAGGHTRVLDQIIRRTDGQQILFLIDQGAEQIPQWFIEKHSDLRICTIEDFTKTDTNSYRLKAIVLRELAQKSKRVVLYTANMDVVPILALSNMDKPVVFMENHAHSWFWLGISIVDVLFSHTKYHVNFTNKYRDISNSYFLPTTQFDSNIPKIFDLDWKIQAKKKIGIPTDKICIMTISLPSKYYPITRKYNYFKLVKKIYEKFENVIIIVVGLDSTVKEIEQYSIDRNRVRFVGFQADLTDYYRACDIAMDSIPEPSLGATSYAAIVGMACPLYKYGGSGVFDASNYREIRKYKQYIGHTKNRREFIEKLSCLISNKELRLQIAEEFRQEFFMGNNEEHMKSLQNSLYQYGDGLNHLVRLPQNNKVFFNEETEEIATINEDVDRILYVYRTYLNKRDFIRLLIKALASLNSKSIQIVINMLVKQFLEKVNGRTIFR